MNKIILFFVVSLAQFSMAQNPCIVTIPDANFKNALLNHNPRIDTNNDGEIQCSEATAFSGLLNVYNKNISDLTGIEDFTRITRLYCDGNQLTNLDVSTNTALQQIQCYNNQLTSLNIGANTVLFSLYLYNNQLTSLDFSANTALKQMAFQNNELTSLNIANGNNADFSELYIDNNPNLTCIQVDDAVYSTTNWTGVSFKKPAGAVWSEDCAATLNVSESDKINPIAIHPNPTSGIAYLSEMTGIQIFDMSGRLILEKSNTNTIDLSKEDSGVYILKTNSQNGIGVTRIIKK